MRFCGSDFLFPEELFFGILYIETQSQNSYTIIFFYEKPFCEKVMVMKVKSFRNFGANRIFVKNSITLKQSFKSEQVNLAAFY